MRVRRNMAARPDRRAENLRRSIVFSGLSAFLLPVKKVNTTTRRETEVRGNMSGSMLLLPVFVMLSVALCASWWLGKTHWMRLLSPLLVLSALSITVYTGAEMMAELV